MFDDLYVELIIHLGLIEQLKLRCINRFHLQKLNNEMIKEYISWKSIHPNNKINFRNACKLGYLNIAKWLYESPDIDPYNGHDLMKEYCIFNGEITLSHTNNDDVFIESCKYGQLEVVKWLYQLGSINIHACHDKAFRISCEKNHLTIAKWLYDLGSVCKEQNPLAQGVDIYANHGEVFILSCKCGRIEVAKWLYEYCNYNFRINYDCSFILSCREGKLEVAKWLYELYEPDDFNECKGSAFLHSCENGRIKVTKWLYEIGNINIHAKEDNAFIRSCAEGHLEVAKWLHELGVDIHTGNNYAFICSSSNRRGKVVKWLYQLGGIDINIIDNYVTPNTLQFIFDCLKELNENDSSKN